MTIHLLPLSEADPEAVEMLLDAAFGSDRHHRTAYRIREGVTALPMLSLAAFDDIKDARVFVFDLPDFIKDQ